ncbi:MAG TPA: GldG family protein [Verrucomicrobiae bacterium]
MPDEPTPKISFSSARRWRIGFDVALRTALVLAIVVMANFISARFYHRFFLSSDTRLKLSSHTIDVLQSLTNHINVTLYYDQSDEMFSTIKALLNEYHLADPNISVQTVDYVRNPADAQKTKEQYQLPDGDEDLVIFDNNGVFRVIPGDALLDQKIVATGKREKDGKIDFRRKPIAFNGEMMFTTFLLAVTNPKPFKAYYLVDDGEPAITDDNSDMGYYKFATEIAQNDIVIQPLSLSGSGSIPDDCDLLIFAGAHGRLPSLEIQKIDQYLSQGGRLFALFNEYSINDPTGLEPVLQRWGVNIGSDWVQDLQNSPSENGKDIIVSSFSKHPVVNPLTGSSLYMILPRPVSRVDFENPPPNAPEVDELAYSGQQATLSHGSANSPQAYPLMVAVEQKPVPGISNPRGLTRIIVAGDSFAFGNKCIENVENRDFVGYAVNWLLGETQMLAGIGPKPVTEYTLVMTRQQHVAIRWLLLGALPGGVLLLGGLVWLVRRK